MNTFQKNKYRVLSAFMSLILTVGMFLPTIALADNNHIVPAGTMFISDGEKTSDMFYVDGSGEHHVKMNAKFVYDGGDVWLPVYCVEHGKTLNTDDKVTAESLTSSTSLNGKTLSPEQIDLICRIYAVGYNGKNGWGSWDPEIASYAARNNRDPNVLPSNPNYQKYVATQVLIWEVTDGVMYYSRYGGSQDPSLNPIQATIDDLRARLDTYNKYLNLYATKDVLYSDVTGCSAPLYRDINQAKAHPNVLSLGSDGRYHFEDKWGTVINPNSNVAWESCENYHNPSAPGTGPVPWVTSTDLCLDPNYTYDKTQTLVTIAWNLVPYNEGYVYHNPTLYRPTAGNQLTFACEVLKSPLYASFYAETPNFDNVSSVFSVEKRTDSGELATGAEFTIYADPQLTYKMGTTTDNGNGTYSYKLDWGSVEKDTTVVLYYKETKVPTKKITSNGTVDIYVAKADTNTYAITLTYDYDDKSLTYSYKMPDGSVKNGNTIKNWGSVWESNKIPLINNNLYPNTNGWINVTDKSVNATLNVEKVTSNGAYKARGAKFEAFSIYSNGRLSGSLGAFSASDSTFTSPSFYLGTFTPGSSNPVTKTFYYKETAPATEYFDNGKWISWKFIPDNSVYKVVFTYTSSTNTLAYRITTVDASGKDISEVTNATISNYLNSSYLATSNPSSKVNNKRTGSVVLYKVDSKGNVVSGAEFKVYSDANCTQYVATANETTTKGTYIAADIVPGTYYVKETKNPNSFNGDPNSYKVVVEEGKVAIVSNSSNTNLGSAKKDGKFVNIEAGTVTVYKESINGVVVSGATFTVYSDAACTKKVNDLSEANGVYSLGGLMLNANFAPATYYLKETKAAPGFNIDPKVYSFTIAIGSLDAVVDNNTNTELGSFAKVGKFVEVPAGTVKVFKISDTDSKPISGATFAVYEDKNCSVFKGNLTETSDGSGIYTLGDLYLNNDLTAKTYFLKELVAPSGFHLDPNVYAFTIKVGNLDVIVDNVSFEKISDYTETGKFVEIEFGSVEVEKVDALDISKKVSGAELSVYRDADCKDYVGKLTETSAGNYSLNGLPLNDDLSDKTYYLKETVAPEGYMLDPNVYAFTLTLNERTKKVDNFKFELISKYAEEGKFVELPYGSVTVYKVGSDTEKAVSGAEFKVYADEDCKTVVGTLKEVESGKYSYIGLPINDDFSSVTYYLKETKAAEGYHLDPNVYPFVVSVEELNPVVDNVPFETIKNHSKSGKFVEIPYGSVTVYKATDISSDLLTGAEFRVYSDENCTDEIGVMSETSEGSGVYVLDNLMLNKDLSATTYYLKETKAPDNHHLDPNVYAFTITVDDLDVTVDNTSFTKISKFKVDGKFVDISYGSVRVIKMNEYGIKLTGAEFKIYEDAEAKSEIGTMIETSYGVYEYSGLSFNDDFSDKTYYLRETVAPEGTELDPTIYSFNITVDKRNAFVTNNNVGDGFINKNGIEKTEFMGFADNHAAQYGEKVELTDYVYYNLIAGLEYEMEGTLYLVDKEGKIICDDEGNPIPLLDENNEPIVSSVKFTPEGVENTLVEGRVEVKFYVDTTLLEGKVICCFEDCYRDKKLVGFHHEVVDEQEVFIPYIYTTFLSADTNTHLIPNGKEVIATDTVAYFNLPNGDYRMDGVLIDKETGKEILDENGKKITGSTSFTVAVDGIKGVDSSVDVKFVFDSDILANHTIVCFETLFAIKPDGKEEELCYHRSLLDKNQSLIVPDIGTSFYDRDLGEDYDITAYGEMQTLVDKVNLDNVIPGDYELVGFVVIKETGEYLKDESGNNKTATTKFSVTEDECEDGIYSGEKFVTFENIDVTGLAGKTLVCFEYLYREGVLIAVHADCNSVTQTLKVPSVGTKLVESHTREKTLVLSEVVYLDDTVRYENLEIGKEVEVIGTLYDADTGEALRNADGTFVTSKVKFTPKTSSGEVVVTFKFNYLAIVNVKRVVAFEDIYDVENKRRIATHADLSDKEQQTWKAEISTVASVDGKKVFKPEDTITITDVLSYDGLVGNRDYKYFGQVMMIDENGNATDFIVDGKAVSTIVDFTADSSGTGTVNATFTFSGKDLRDKTKLVVFVTVVDKTAGYIVATEKDAACEEQTVTVAKTPITSTGESLSATSNVGIILLAVGLSGVTVIVVRAFRKPREENPNE